MAITWELFHSKNFQIIFLKFLPSLPGANKWIHLNTSPNILLIQKQWAKNVNWYSVRNHPQHHQLKISFVQDKFHSAGNPNPYHLTSEEPRYYYYYQQHITIKKMGEILIFNVNYIKFYESKWWFKLNCTPPKSHPVITSRTCDLWNQFHDKFLLFIVALWGWISCNMLPMVWCKHGHLA